MILANVKHKFDPAMEKPKIKSLKPLAKEH